MRVFPAAEFAAADVEIDRCWKRIGIHGDKSCPELAGHAHCRNCPVFSLAAATLLDRELPDDAAVALANQLGADDEAKADTQSVMIFRVGAEWFALPTLAIDEVIGLRPIHSLPHRRNSGLLGLVNVRGELVACVSIAQLLVGASSAGAPQGRLIVARHATGRLAFPVDEVQHTHHCSPSDLNPVPATVARSASSFTRGLLSWRGRTVGHLDEQLLFDALNRCLT